MDVLISGAGIAGPALAFWLTKGGHNVTIVETASKIRDGGYVIDFWGIGFDIAEKMGVLPMILKKGYQVKEVRYIGPAGERSGGFTTDAIVKATGGRFTSIKRSDISEILFRAVEPDVETIFGDSILRLEQDARRVGVEFRNNKPREFDLVFGCDGLHSNVRQLAFPGEERAGKFLGYYVAAFNAKAYPHRNELVYMMRSLPGKQVSRFSMRDDNTLFLFVFRSELLTGGIPDQIGEQRRSLASIFKDAGWEIDDILTALDRTDELYFDQVSQIQLDRWHNGRSALVGDAAAAVSLLAGEGTGLAIAEAYTLAGELERSSGNHAEAFIAYHSRLGEFLRRKQRSAASFASFFAPKTDLGVTLRNWSTKLLSVPILSKYVIERTVMDDIELPEYALA